MRLTQFIRITGLLFLVFLIALAFSFPVIAGDEDSWPRNEEQAVYTAITKDNQVEHVEDVIVTRTTPFSLEFTVRDCDGWIQRWTARKAQCNALISQWKDIRSQVLEKAKGVRLKKPNEKTL